MRMRALELYEIFGGENAKIDSLLEITEKIFVREGGTKHLPRYQICDNFLCYVESVLDHLNRHPQERDLYVECFSAVLKKKQEEDRYGARLKTGDIFLELVKKETKLAYKIKNKRKDGEVTIKE